MISLLDRDAEFVIETVKTFLQETEKNYHDSFSKMQSIIQSIDSDKLDEKTKSEYVEGVKNLKLTRFYKTQACNKIIELMEAGSELLSEWRPLSVEKPNIGERVLFCVSKDFVFEGCLLPDGKIRRHGCNNYEQITLEKVRFWMPLPRGVCFEKENK